MSRCEDKVAYFSKNDAKARLKELKNEARKRGYTNSVPQRVYKCEVCGNYHLTSRPLVKHEQRFNRKAYLGNLAKKGLIDEDT